MNETHTTTTRNPARRIGRRSLLRGAAGLGVLAAAPTLRLFAQGQHEHRFIFCYFRGGWDVMLGPDGREPTATNGLARIQGPARYRQPTPVTLGGRETLWGGTMRSVRRHADVTTCINGVNMNSVSHPTAQAYMVSGLQPAGSTVRGNALGTHFAAGGPLDGEDAPILPNVAIGLASTNVDYPTQASAIQLSRPERIAHLIGEPAVSRRFAGELEGWLQRARESSEGCAEGSMDSPLPGLRLSRQRLERMRRERVAHRFAFDAETTQMQAIRARFFGGAAPTRGPAMQAATAAQLLSTGLARSVSIALSDRVDHHFANWRTDHAPMLEDAFDALGNLLDHLREDDPLLERTTVMATSEFSRQPTVNARGGKDHWFAGSFLVFGGGMKPGRFGRTTAELGLRKIDDTTGQPSDAGSIIRPERVYATVVKAAGLDWTAFRVDALDAWIGR